MIGLPGATQGKDLVELEEALHEGAAGLGLSLANEQCDQLLRYVALLAQWNRIYNLTAVREPRAMVTQHIIDCLATIGPLRRQLRTMAQGRRLLDVGSGAGLPGVVIAVAMPEVDVVCVDSVGKKASFIAQAAATLDLRNLQSRHARIESLGELPAFDVIASRAFASTSDFVESSAAWLAPGGAWMAMKSRPAAEELAALDCNRFMFHVEQLHVPQLNAERCLIWVKRSNDSVRPLSG